MKIEEGGATTPPGSEAPAPLSAVPSWRVGSLRACKREVTGTAGGGVGKLTQGGGKSTNDIFNNPIEPKRYYFL